MAKIYYDLDADLEVIKEEKTVAVIGYGNQGRAQALNMRDSGLDIILGLRVGGASWDRAKADGFEPYTIEEAAEKGDIIHMLIPDIEQPAVYRTQITSHMKEGKALGFSHGFNIHFKQIVPPPHVDVIMIAPKSPGKGLRDAYVNGFGVPALIAVAQDYSGRGKDLALAMSKAMGCTRAGVLETTFKEETETDLFGEQSVLVGGLISLITKGFEVLVKEGYQPELAYFEVCNEMKLIMDLVYKSGFTGMLKAVSDTAKYGGLTVGPKVVDEHVRENMKKILKDIQSGKFAEEWAGNLEKSKAKLNALMREVPEHKIEEVGRFIRKMAGIEK
ncbi:MAG: ketol-acid reductoisomerase [archaeon]|nr:ketol-acid reductoisomerase [archaeon]MCP8306185.1 ketol-acid reductoisomerase [archaeon]